VLVSAVGLKGRNATNGSKFQSSKQPRQRQTKTNSS
jgi:hypothetical protein